MLKASKDYMHANSEEVYGTVGKTYNVDPAIFRGLQATMSEFPAALEEKDIVALAKEWELAHKYKLLTSIPQVERFIWSGVESQEIARGIVMELYFAATPNGQRALIALEETGLSLSNSVSTPLSRPGTP